MGTRAGAKTNRGWEMRLPKFRCKNKIGNWCFFTVLHNGNVNEENFNLETLSQFTGLFDKQAVEIYEYMGIDNIYEVSFFNASYILTNISNGDIILLSDYMEIYNGKVKITKEYTKI